MDEGQRVTTLQDRYYDEERQYLADEQVIAQPDQAAEKLCDGRAAEQQPASPQTAAPAEEAIAMIRAKLRERGARGFIGFRRVFKIADNDGSRSLDWPEFWQVFQDYRLQVTDDDLRAAFGAFDVNGDQSVNFDEFLRHVVGEMNPARKALVARAFAKLDRDGSGEVDKHDVTGIYDASEHPDVQSGKKTGEEILTEFLDTFEIHSSLINPEAYNSRVSLGEFTEYYNNISANIDDDEYFALMITNAWKLDTVAPAREAWTADH